MKTWAGKSLGRLLLAALIYFMTPRTACAAPPLPTVDLQPQSQSMLAGSNALFTAGGSGQGTLFYQWTFNGTNLANNAHTSGATSTNLLITGIAAGDAGNYQFSVTDNRGTTFSSNATLTVLFPPAITGQPTNQSVILTSNASFTATASGTAPLSYQWQKNGANLNDGGTVTGAASATLSISGVLTNDAGAYQVFITNNYGLATSAVVTLSVLLPPVVVMQPTNRTVLLGSTTVFVCDGAGTGPLIYQWQKNGINLAASDRVSGTATASLMIQNTQPEDSGAYTLIVSNTFGADMSVEANLSVVPIRTMGSIYGSFQNIPLNLTDAIRIAGGDDSSFVIRSNGSLVAWGYDSSGNTIVPAGATNIVAVAPGIGFTLALRTNNTIVGWGLNGPTNPPAGLTNVVAIDTRLGNGLALDKSGKVTLWQSDVSLGQIASNAISMAAGNSAGSYHYLVLKDNGTIVGFGDNTYGQATPPAGLSNVVAVAVGSQHSLALKSDGTVTGWGWSGYGSPTPPPGLSNVVAISAGSYHSLALTRSGTVIGWGNANNGAINIPAGLSNVVAISAGDNHSLALVENPAVQIPPSIWWQDSTNLVVMPGQTRILNPILQGSLPIRVQWYFNGVAVPGETNQWMALTSVGPGQVGAYHFVANNKYGSVTSQVAVLTEPPIIVTQPVSQSLVLSSNAIFTATAAGPEPLSYQWYFNGLALTNGGRIGGPTTANLSINSIQTNDAGSYQLVVTNLYGTATSTSVMLTVLLPPLVITSPTDQTIAAGTSTSFIVEATGTPPLSYQWYSNGVCMTSGGRFTGTTSAMLNISFAQTNDSANYQVIVTNNYGSAISAVAALTVLSPIPPSVITSPTNRTVAAGTSPSFTVAAVGTAPLSYQWYSNGVPLVTGGRFAGTTTSTFTLFSSVTNDSANYHVIITNDYGSATSAVATLTVLTRVTITNHPASQSALLGSQGTFSVTAAGSVPAYQWYFNGAPLTDVGRISGSSSSTLSIANVQASDAGGYFVVITNQVSSATSRMASLTPQAVLTASTRYVRTNNTSAQTPFLDWNTAATNIQDAVDAAVAGDFILASNGTYNVGGRAVFAAMTNRVVIDKAVTVQSVNGPAATTIAGIPGTGSYLSAGYRCVYLTNGAALIGFTLTNGATRIDTSYTDLVREQYGAGVWCESLSAIISNCVITRCYANKAGGGIYQGTVFSSMVTNCSAFYIGGGTYASDLNNCIVASNRLVQGSGGGGTAYGVVSNSLLVWNSASSGGGAFYSALYNCIISNNSASLGGGVFAGTANNSLISSNRAFQYGGGAYSNVLNNCVLQNNQALHGGGAYSSRLSDCNLTNNRAIGGAGGGAYQGTLTNCVLYGNWAYNSGGGIYSATLYQCQVISNSTSYLAEGGVAYNSICVNSILTRNTGGAYNSQLYNCTVVSNTGTWGVYGGTLYNSVVYYNSNNNWSLGATKFNNCLTFPTSLGVVSTNAPLFVNLAGGDFHLQSNSPCINAGNNAYVTNSVDLDGNPRLVGGTLDIGAYEYQTPASTLSYAWAQQYGLPIDGSADNTDNDSDGMNNFAECKSGTNPTNTLSVLKLDSPAPGISGFIVTWQSVGGILYYVQRSTNLSEGFSTIVSNRPGSFAAGITSYADTTATNKVPYFYRVGVH